MLRSVQLFLIGMLCAFFSEAQITSSFDTDADGWTVFFGASGASISGTHSATAGNPGGHSFLSYTSATTSVQSWIAPAKFLGNKAVRSFGMNLRFDLQQSIASTSSGPQGSVRIESSSGSLIYVFSAAERPTTTWRSYVLKLDETGGWRWNATTGPVATRLQVKEVLGDIDAIEIAASYAASASYTARIDNVVLEEKILAVAPTITGFTPSSGVAGTTVTITGTNFDAVPANNTVYFSGREAIITSASPTQIIVTVPQGASYGPITVINKTTGLLYQSLRPFNPTFNDGGRIIPSSLALKTDIVLTGVTDIHGLASADIDGDGWMDIIVSENTGTTSVFRNLGTGGDLSASSFAPKVSLAGSNATIGIWVEDLDGDGKHDVVSAYSNGSQMSYATFRNISTSGNIVFEAAELWPALAYSGMLSDVVDVDGDGRLDLVGQHRNGSVTTDFWITQNISSPGQIEFAATTSYFGSSTLDAGDGVGHGDLDNDGKPEMLVVHSFGGQFQILKNTSTPAAISFGTPFAIPEGVNGSPIVADFNLDGLNDIAFKQGFSNDDIIIRINSNSGGLLSAADFATEIILNTADFSNYGGVSIADINGDGKPDLLATDAGNIAVFENVYSGGAFTSAAFVPGYVHQGAGNSTYPTTPVASDLNRDGKPDLIMGVTNTTPNRISIFQNKNVHTPVISLTTVSPLKGIVGSTVTITGDYFSTVPTENIVKFGGVRATVLTATRTQLTVEVPAGAAYSVVSVTRNELTASYHLPFNVIFSPGRTLDATSFGAAVNYALTGADFDVDVEDLNGDNKIDVVAEGTAGAYIFRNDYTTGPISVTTLSRADTTNSTAQNPRLLDIDGDGRADIISEQGIYRNITSGSAINFDNLVAIGGTGGTDVGDFNLDGKFDFTGVAFGPVEVVENRSRPGAFVTGTFASVSTPFTFPTGGQAVSTAVADFDNDGFKDFASTVQASVDYIAFYRNVGQYRLSATSFVSGQNINTLDLPGRVYEADFDVDGKMDVFVYHGAGANPTMFSVFHNQSTGPGNFNFVKHDYTIPIVGFVCGPSTVSDLDGDGRPEIVITSNSTAAGFVIVKNNSTPGTIGATSFAPSALIGLTGLRSVTAADINSDSKPDLIFTRAPNLMSIMENLVTGVPITITTQPSSNSVCSNASIVLGVTAAGEPGLQYQWQEQVGATFTNLTDNANYSGTTTASLTISNLATTKIFRVRVIGTFAIATSSAATITVNTAPAPPVATGGSGCAGTSVSLIASGGTNGQYRWYTSLTGGSAIAGEVNSTLATPPLASTTSYFVALNNGTCEGTRAEAIASITTIASPTTTPASRCGNGAVTLSAAGGTDGNYRWYDVATGGTAISGAVNSSFTTASLSASTTYHVALSDGTCESSRTPVTATLNNPPAKPVVTSSVSAAANVVTICSGSVSLSAPAGFTYLWSTGATTQQITLSSAGTFTVQVIDANNCASASSDAIQVVIDPISCNKPPVIDQQELTAAIEGVVSLDLSTIISDPDNNIDLSSITIVTQPASGAVATISNGQLQLNYSGVSFSGTDLVTIRVCDLAGSCTTENLTIEVIGDIEVFNAISPNGDGLNEFLRIQYIEVLERTRNNKVTVLNRWGDKVFEIANYDNNTRVFKGANNNGVELPSGTYYYKIEFTGQNAPAMKTGYLTLKR